jgi:hypothetical protein
MDPVMRRVPESTLSTGAVVLGLPGVILACSIVVLAVASAAGLAPTAGDYQLTLAEAAALHDIAEIVRLVRTGADPRQPAPVRAGILREQRMVVTPMTAAILERRVDVIAVLADVGARIRAEELPQYWCLAKVRGDAAVLAAIEAQAPPPANIDCPTALRPPGESNE